MVLRRFTAVLLTLLTLHLNFLGADFACASHGEHNANPQAVLAAAETQSAHHHASADQPAAHPLPDSASEEEPCELPAQTTCCQALASCSLVFSAHNDLHAEHVLSLRDVIVRSSLQSPLSEIVAPEPPPPKA